GVTILSAPPQPGKPLTKLAIDEATVRVALLPLLFGDKDASFSATALGGKVSGVYEQGSDDSIDVVVDSIDLARVAPISDLLGVPIAGKLSGTAQLTFPEGKVSKASGSISIEVRDVAVGDAKAKIQGTIALPKVDVGVLTIAAEAKDGVLKISKLVAGGRDVSVQGDGRVAMRDDATDSLLDVGVRFRINDAYRTKSDLTKSLFGAPGSTVPGLFELADPRIKESKRADGSYGWTVRGSLGHPEFVPAGGPSSSAIRP
ncbi:MAG: type II secretion system protein GspN, partial [Polyangiaceae bacterium]